MVFTSLAGGNTINIVINAVDKFSNTFDRVGKNISKSSKSIAFDLAAVTTGFAAVGIGIASVTKEYGKFESVQSSFNKLMGEDAVDSLELFRKSANGLIDDFTLMKNANLLFQNIATATPEQFAKITQASIALGRAVGIDATEAFERLTLGIAKGETELLDELGLKLDATIANKEYADSLGISTSALDANQRATAALNAILPEIEARVSNLGDTSNELLDNNARLGVSFANLRVQLGEVFAPTVETTTKSATGIINTITQWIGKNDELLKSWLNLPKNFALGIGVIQLKFKELQLGAIEFANEVVVVFDRMGNAVVSTFNGIIEGINKIPGFGKIPLIPEVNLDRFLISTSQISEEIEAAKEALDLLSTGETRAGRFLESLMPTMTTIGTPTISPTSAVQQAVGTTSLSVAQLSSFKQDLIDQAFILDEIGGRQEELNALVSQADIFGQAITAAGQTSGAIVINIENVNGMDATEIANALQDTLSTQIR